MAFIHLSHDYVNIDRIDLVRVLDNKNYEVHVGGQPKTILVSPDSDDGKALIKYLREHLQASP